MVFANRVQAAFKLIPALEKYRGESPLVLAIPRGAVPIGEVLVNSLGGELDLLLAAKISDERHPELALGSVSESGLVHWEPQSENFGGTEESRLKQAREAIVELQRARARWAPLVRPSDAKDRNVIIVDDGIATGATMTVAIRAIRAQHPHRLTIATPVASASALERLRGLVDEIVALEVPRSFFSVSQFYDDFSQVSDDDVVRILQESRKKRPLREASRRGLTSVESSERSM